MIFFQFLPIVLTVTTSEILILDPRTLQQKYKIELPDLIKITMSTYNDDLCVFHVRQHKPDSPNTTSDCLKCSSENNELRTKNNCFFEQQIPSSVNTKGDLILHTCHLVEMVAKIFLVRKNWGLLANQTLFLDSFSSNEFTQEQEIEQDKLLDIQFSNEFVIFN